MRGPEAKLYQKLKKSTSNIIFNRIENISIPGMPDVLGYTEKFWYFTVEFKVTRSNKLKFSPHQIAYHVAHPHNSFILAEALGSGTVKLYEGSVIQELDACGLALDPLCLTLDACCLWLQELGA